MSIKSTDGGRKFAEIVTLLRKDILGGKYFSPKNPFPSERALVRRFGVSRSTISLALQDLCASGFIVRKHGKGTFLTCTAKKLGGAIGIIVPGITHEEIFPPIFREFSRLAQEEGCPLLFGDVSSEDPVQRAVQSKRLAEDYAHRGISGVVFQPIEFVRNATSINREILSVFDKAKIPVALLDYDIVPPPDRSSYDLVGIDNFDAGRRIATHLVAVGARRIAFLMRPNWGFSVRDRYAGVKYVASETGCAAKETKIVCEPDDIRFLKKVFSARNAPDAVVCGNDTAAANLLATFRQLGIKVPEQVLVAGFDDVQHARIVNPPLTTVHQPCETIARAVFDALRFRQCNPDAFPRKITLTAPVVVRASTRREKKCIARRTANGAKAKN
jgi:LacI family transcriptional regulator